MKKLLIFLMVTLPVIIILILNATISVVTDIVSIPVEKIELSSVTYVSNIDESYQLTANIFPTNATDKNVIYESTDENILSVDKNGKVTFLNFGNAYVIATTLDGNKQSSCYFVVTDTKVHSVLLYTIDEVNEVKIGGTLQAYSEILPKEASNKNVEYFSSNENVATIDGNGLITGHSVGETYISVKTIDGEFTDVRKFTVFREIESFILTQTNAVLEKPAYQIPVDISPSDANISRINFSSSNESVATVSNSGVVNFLKEGKVTISLNYNGIEKQTTLEFTNGYIQDIILKNTLEYCNYNQVSFLLDYDVYPKNLYNTELEFNSTNTKVAEINNNGLIELKSGGKTTIIVQATKYDGTILSKSVTLFVQRDCTEIIASDVVTARPYVSVVYNTLPLDNTSDDFIYILDSEIASVDTDGNVTFTAVGSVNLTIQSKNAEKTIKITYTGGYAQNFEIQNHYELFVGDIQSLTAKYFPQDTTIKTIDFTILNQTSNIEGQNVISIEDNVLTAISSGSAVIEAKLTCVNNTVRTENITIIVKQNVSEILFDLDLEEYDNRYITAVQTVNLKTNILPNDATEIDIIYIVQDKQCCSINGNKLFFNYPTTIELTAKNTINNIEKTIMITYTNTIISAEFEEISEQLSINDTILIEVKKCVPNALNSNLMLKIASQKNNAGKNVLTIQDNLITAVSGGEAQVSVYLSGIFVKSFTINVNRIAESIDVYPKNIKTTSSEVTLYSTILPEDTTNKNVVYTLQEEDIAIICNNVLTFIKKGIVNITAKTTDGSNLEISFTIEKLSINQDISTDTKEHTIYVGQSSILKSDDYADIEYSIVSGEENINIDDNGVLSAIKAGISVVNVVFKESNGFVAQTKSIKFNIFELTTDFELLNFDKYQNIYLTASEENILSFKIFPDKAKQDIEYNLNETSIAKIEDNKLIFYGAGVVELRANSADQNCIRMFSIRYTGGGAFAYESNLQGEISLLKGQSINVEISKWYPNNTINKSYSIKVLGDINQQIISIENNKITAISGGEIEILFRVSANLTEVIKIVVNEEISSIKFKNIPSLTYETSININYEIMPLSVTNKAVVIEVDNNENACISNNTLIFKKPSKIKLKIYAKNNKDIFDEVEVESTMGFVKSFELSEYLVTLNTSTMYQPKIINTLPNVINQIYTFEIVESSPIIENTNVVSIINNKIIAENGGTAKIKITAKTDYENPPYKFIQILVVKELERLDVKFDREVYKKNDTYILASNTLKFEVLPYPLDIDISNYNIIYDKSYVKIENNIITFLNTGITTIKYQFGDVSNSIDFLWTNNECIEAKVDESEFIIQNGEKVKTVKVADTFEFIISNIEPQDVSYRSIKIVEKSVTNNYHSLKVYELNNKVICFLNGGEVTFEIFVNSLSVGEYTFIVIRTAQEIKTDTTHYTGVNTYLINAEVLPYDTSNKQLTYKLADTNIAQININGEVVFTCEGSVCVTISHSDGIIKNIEVVYSRKVENIAIEKTKTVLSVGGTVLLKIHYFPSDIENVKLIFISSDDNIATVTSKGRVIANNTSGYVTITAYLEEDNTIFDSITFIVSEYITNIALKNDIANDNLGIKGERVFGNKYLNTDNTFSNTYQMEILSITPTENDAELIWTSSDEKIATVNKYGLVSFISEGSVTIRVEPKEQFSAIKPVFDSYTFKVVNAVNVFTYDEFMFCSYNKLAVVLQNDLILTDNIIQKYNLKTISITNNLYGNGFMITGYNLSTSDNKFTVSNDVTIDNVTIRGEDLTNKTLEDLTYKSNLMILWYVKNVTINNSILENGLHCIRVYCSVLNTSGSIFRNAGVANMILSHESNSQIQSVVTAKNCIFKDALFGSIVYDFDNSDNDTYASKFIAKEKLYIYNFRRADEMVCPIVSDYVPNITSSLQELFAQFENIKHKYNGKEYYHLGIIILNADYVVGKYNTKYKLDLTNMSNINDYSLTKVTGNVFVYDVYPIIFDIELLTIMPGSTTITPASTFNSTIYKQIREI